MKSAGLLLAAAGAALFGVSSLKTGPEWADAAQVSIDLYEKGEYSLALPAAEKELAIALRSFGDDDIRTVYSKDHLGKICLRTGQPDRAMELFVQTVATNERILDPDNPRQAYYLANLAFRQAAAGAYDKAQDTLIKSLRLLQKNYEEISRPVGEGYARLGHLYYLWGRYKQAGEVLRRAREINSRIQDSDSVIDAGIDLDLWLLDYSEGDGARQHSSCEKALSRLKNLLPPNHPDVGRALNAAAMLDMERGNLDSARDNFMKAEAIFALYHGVEDRGLIEARLGLAALDKAAHRKDKYMTLLPVYVAVVGGNNIAAALAYSKAAEMLRRDGKQSDAAELYAAALASAAEAPGEHPAIIARITLSLAELDAAKGNTQSAKNRIEGILSGMRGSGTRYGMDFQLREDALYALARVYIQNKDPQRARAIAGRMEKDVENNLGRHFRGNAAVLGQILDIYKAVGDKYKAAEYAGYLRAVSDKV